MQGNTALVAVQANKAIAQVETNFIDLPKDNQRNDGNSHQGGQMKESIQQLIKHNFSIRSHAARERNLGTNASA